MTRLGRRRGQLVADALRIVVRDEEEDDDDDDKPMGKEKEDSTPSPTSTTFKIPSPTTVTTPPQPIVTSISPATTSVIISTSVSISTATTLVTTTAASIGSFMYIPPSSTIAPSAITRSLTPSLTPPPTSSLVPSLSPSSAPSLVPSLAPSSLASSLVPEPVTTGSVLITTLSSFIATSTISSAPELESAQLEGLGEVDDALRGRAQESVGIAIGVGAAAALIVSGLFILWKTLRRRDSPQSRYSGSTSPPPSYHRRYTHRSDDRIINEFMTAAYDVGNPSVNGYYEKGAYYGGDGHPGDGYPGDGYPDDKRYTAQSAELPIMLMPPQPLQLPIQKPPPQLMQLPIQKSEPQPAHEDSKLKSSISSWLSRHHTHMLNPHTARASVASSAQDTHATEMRNISGWRDEPAQNTAPQMPLPPVPPQQQKNPVFRGQGVDFPRAQYPNDPAPAYQPVNPENLRLPPPPGVLVSATGTTEASGTWNTWGVMQHPK